MSNTIKVEHRTAENETFENVEHAEHIIRNTVDGFENDVAIQFNDGSIKLVKNAVIIAINPFGESRTEEYKQLFE